MFGTYRTLLAIAVVVDHFMALGISSSPAVYGFFCLSGFLMTMLMQGPYAGRPGVFFLNRFLRIYPIYWCALALSVFLGGSWPSIADVLLIVLPDNAPAITIAWAITVEIVFYILIGAGLSRTRNLSIAWLIVSTGFTATMYFTHDFSADRRSDLIAVYFPIWSGSLPFAAGAVLFHLRGHLRISPKFIPIALLGIVVTMIAAGHAYYTLHRVDLMMIAIYVSLPFNALAVSCLSRINQATLDDLIGRLSYPVYLLQSAAFILATRHGLPTDATPLRGLVVLAITIILALIATVLVDTPVQRLRMIVKSRPLNIPEQPRYSQPS